MSFEELDKRIREKETSSYSECLETNLSKGLALGKAEELARKEALARAKTYVNEQIVFLRRQGHRIARKQKILKQKR